MYNFVLTSTKDIANKKKSFCIYGEPKIGKTSLVKTIPVENDNEILYIPADPGYLALAGREFLTVQIENNKWTIQKLEDLIPWVASLAIKKKIKWVIIDGLDDIGIAVLNEKKGKMTNMLKAYGEMADWLDSWIKTMRDIDGINTIFITHITELDEGEGEKTKFYPSIPGKKMLWQLDKYFDVIMCMRAIQTENGVYRKIQTRVEADPRFVVGDRSGSLLPIEEPDLGIILEKIKTNLPGSMSEKIGQMENHLLILKAAYQSPDNKRIIDQFLEESKVQSPRSLSMDSLQRLVEKIQ